MGKICLLLFNVMLLTGTDLFQEICDNPQMVVGGASRFDIKQGVLGKETSPTSKFRHLFYISFWG